MTSAQSKPPQPDRPDPGLAELFVGFLSIGVVAFGGVLPITRRAMVERYKWINEEEFIELLSLSQFLPGPNITNFAVVLGSRFRGPAGSVSAVLGLDPGAGDHRHPARHRLQLLRRCESAGRRGRRLRGSRGRADHLHGGAHRRADVAPSDAAHLGIALAAFAGVALIGFPLPWVMLVLAPLSVVLAWRALP